MAYALKLRQFPTHPSYDLAFPRQAETLFENRTRRTTPFHIRMHMAFEESGIAPKSVMRIDHLATPPWELHSPTVDLSLTSIKKNDTSPDEFHSLALELINQYIGHSAFYTDGSKTDAGGGCAFVCGDITRSFSLPAQATVFSSELMAIIKALCFIDVCDSALHVIFSDPLSSLLALRQFYPMNPLLQEILLRITTLHQAGKTVKLCWIPSHVGIIGNEKADAAAKRSALAPCLRRLPLPAKDFFSSVHKYIQKEWQTQWDNEWNNKLRKIKPHLGEWQSSSRRSRREEVILCRLRVGHTLATHRYLLCRERKPRCQRCSADLSVRHVLVSCPGYIRERTCFFGQHGRRLSLRALLGDESPYINDVFGFLTEIGFKIVFTPG